MFADALRGTPALDQVYGAVLRKATSQDDQRHLLQALNRTDAGWTDDYVHGVLNRDAWAIGTTFTGDVGFVADVTHKLATGDAKGALSAVAGAVLLSKVGEVGGIVAGKAVTIIKDTLSSTKGASDSVLPLVVKETATTGTAGDALTEVPLLKPEAPNPSSVVEVPRGNEVDSPALAGFPEVPPGYSTLKSGGAAANETGGLPDGYRRLVSNDGENVIQGPAGEIYGTEELLTQALKSDIKFVPSDTVKVSDAHSVNTITQGTRFGAGNRTVPKTVAKGDVNFQIDIDEISAGKAKLLENGDILTSSGRVYGTHPGSSTVFPKSGLGLIQLSQAEFGIYKEMLKSGGLQNNALKRLDALLKAGNNGVDEFSEEKLVELFWSKK